MNVGTNPLQENVCLDPQIQTNNSNINFTQNVSGGNIVVINNYYKKGQQQQTQPKKKDSPPDNINPISSNVPGFKPMRYDRNGILIAKKGKQKVTFIDKVTKNKLADISEIESFKQENVFEVKSASQTNMSCCLII